MLWSTSLESGFSATALLPDAFNLVSMEHPYLLSLAPFHLHLYGVETLQSLFSTFWRDVVLN